MRPSLWKRDRTLRIFEVPHKLRSGNLLARRRYIGLELTSNLMLTVCLSDENTQMTHDW